jgi:hypothetical protein
MERVMPYKSASRKKEYMASYHHSLVSNRKRNHICIKCTQPIDDLKFIQCVRCRADDRLLTITLRKQGICTSCSKRKVQKGKASCRRCSIVGRLSKLGLSSEDSIQATKALKKNKLRCDCCNSPHPNSSHDWAIDHDHKTKKFRGILCHSCNLALGHTNDDVATLKKLIKYLERIS